MQSKLAFDAVATYVPTWTGLTTNPVLGNGTIAGRYTQIGKIVFLHIYLLMGGTTTYGTGFWKFSLPVTAIAAATSKGRNGTARFTDSSATATYGSFARADDTNGVTLRTSAAPTVLVDLNNPFVWATGDELEVDIVYEAA